MGSFACTDMPKLSERILDVIQRSPGLTDREITNQLSGRSAPQQPVNIAARALARKGKLIRTKRADGLVGNFLPETGAAVVDTPPEHKAPGVGNVERLSEDSLKKALERWLDAQGWQSDIAWGRKHGVDVRATRNAEKWIIEVKGIGSLDAMRVNYFIGILGETLQRMSDPSAKYSIALPDVPQFRGLWTRLPALAKKRTGITVLFVSADGAVSELIE